MTDRRTDDRQTPADSKDRTYTQRLAVKKLVRIKSRPRHRLLVPLAPIYLSETAVTDSDMRFSEFLMLRGSMHVPC